jgi:hypothetical protein
VSSDTFLLDDGTGQVVIDPDRAQIYTTDYRRWYSAGRRYTEWLLAAGGSVYALGELTTEGGAATAFETSSDISALLTEWKQNKAKMLEQFDLDRDGQIDLKERALARSAALREVNRQHQQVRAQPGVHVVRTPRDGRMFLLSNLTPSSSPAATGSGPGCSLPPPRLPAPRYSSSLPATRCADRRAPPPASSRASTTYRSLSAARLSP